MNYEETLIQSMEEDPTIVVLTAENRAPIRNLPSRFPERFVDTGITEQTMVGAAAGFALRGKRPVVHGLATFLTMRAFEFIRTDIGIAHLPVKLVGFVPGFLSESNGPTHQALEDLGLMRGIPGMEVYCPTDEVELAQCLPDFLASPHPGYLRYNNRGAQVHHAEDYQSGVAEQWGNGTDVAILTYGTLFSEAIETKKLLEKQGIYSRVLNLRTLQPLDTYSILDAVSHCNLTVTLEDHFLRGGLFSVLSELLALEEVATRLLPLGMDQKWFTPCALGSVLEAEGFTPSQIAQKITGRLEQERLCPTR